VSCGGTGDSAGATEGAEDSASADDESGSPACAPDVARFAPCAAAGETCDAAGGCCTCFDQVSCDPQWWCVSPGENDSACPAQAPELSTDCATEDLRCAYCDTSGAHSFVCAVVAADGPIELEWERFVVCDP
jgi:hypothetical protein